MIGNNCQDWVEWLLRKIDPNLAKAMWEHGVRKVSETFVGKFAESIPSSYKNSTILSKPEIEENLIQFNKNVQASKALFETAHGTYNNYKRNC